MKAILIDPYSAFENIGDGLLQITPHRAVREIEIESGIDAIYEALSTEQNPVTCFDVCRIADGDGIFVDDEGLLKPCDHFFIWKDYPQPLAGRGLILGCDEEGNSVAPRVTLEEARKAALVGYLSLQLDPQSGEIEMLPQHFARFYAGEAA